MSWWKRVLFSVASLVWGFISLDYLYLAFSLLTNTRANANYNSTQQEMLMQLAGAGLFLIWFLLMAAYTKFLRSISLKIDMIEEDHKTGEQKVRRKWFDIVFQYAFIITGALLRWGYLSLIYFPNR